MTRLLSRAAALLWGVCLACGVHAVHAAPLFPPGDQTTATIYAKDALAVPNQAATVEAKLVLREGRHERPISGETLELVQDGTVVARAATDGSGHVRLSYSAKRRGAALVTLRVAADSRFSATAGATAAIWERRAPLLAVETASLSETPESLIPLSDASDELGKLSQFYYNIMYVVTQTERPEDAFVLSARARQWLAEHKFPLGYIVVVPATEGALGAHIDALRLAGWTTLKVGVGRTRRFAEAFLERRLDAVMVPEPAKGEMPRKAKVAKDWKEVRKKL